MKSRSNAWRREAQDKQQNSGVDLPGWSRLQWHKAVALCQGLNRDLLKLLLKMQHMADTFKTSWRNFMARPQERIEMPKKGSARMGADGAQRGFADGTGSQAASDRTLEVRENATYQDVLDAPEHKVAELLDGTLYLMSRPAGPHANAAIALGGLLLPPFKWGDGGPGGWIILPEPELHLSLDIKVTAPDLAGWRLTTMSSVPESHKITVTPDWVCEVLSPSTRKIDLEVKLPEYAKAGIKHIWIIDPAIHSLKVFELQAGALVQIADLGYQDKEAQVPPFDAVPLKLARLWE